MKGWKSIAGLGSDHATKRPGDNLWDRGILSLELSNGPNEGRMVVPESMAGCEVRGMS